MPNSDISKELVERYLQTGKIGFYRPKNKNEALSLIETVLELYRQEPEVIQEVEEITFNLKDLTSKLTSLLK